MVEDFLSCVAEERHTYVGPFVGPSVPMFVGPSVCSPLETRRLVRSARARHRTTTRWCRFWSDQSHVARVVAQTLAKTNRKGLQFKPMEGHDSNLVGR